MRVHQKLQSSDCTASKTQLSLRSPCVSMHTFAPFKAHIPVHAKVTKVYRQRGSELCSTAQDVVPVTSAKSSANGGVFDTVVVGAGISGLVTAQALTSKHGIKNFLVTEARERVGGNITSRQEGGYIWEEGPNSFQPSDSVLQIAVDAGCENELVLGDPKAPRFVYWEGSLREIPGGPDPVAAINVLGIWGCIRAGLGAVGIKPSPPGYEETVEQFIKRNLGDSVFFRLIEPFCSGVYAGNPAKLGMKAAFPVIQTLEEEGGSLIGGAVKRITGAKPAAPRNPKLPPKPKGQTVGSFRNGLMTLPRAIEKNVKDSIRVNWKLVAIARDASKGIFTLTYETPSGTETILTRSVAMTVPSYVAADLLKEHSPEAAKALSSFDYPPVAAVTVAYPLDSVRADRKAADGSVPGFGQLHPRTQGIVTLGTIYSSSLFPGRAPTGEILLLNYIGGAMNRKIMDMSQEDIVKQVDKDVREMLIKPDAPPPRVVGVRVWPKAIPQFNVGHMDTLETAQTSLKNLQWDGFYLGGNYVYGVALGKCVEYGYEFANKIADFVSKSKVAA